MQSAPYQEVLASTLDSNEQDWKVTPFTDGLINHTYKVSIPSSNSHFVLQRINEHVFPDPGVLVKNYELIWQHLFVMNVKVPEPLPFPGGNFVFVDRNGGSWRKFEHIEKSTTYNRSSGVDQSTQVAETFAKITGSFDTEQLQMIRPTIPGFHDLALRYKQFTGSIKMKDPERLMKAASLIQELKQREHYVSFYEVITGSPEFKQRLMHHDAKIANILFDAINGEVICAIDLDTCMPGYFFSDLGDMIRSMAGSNDESAQAEQMVKKDHYDAIVSGYTRVLGNSLTEVEKKYIHCAGLLMTYMQALRFLTDYLEADKYYQTTYPGQNLDRAANQVALLKSLETFLLGEYEFKL